ncbi:MULTISPECIES: dimethylsulfonioproprionate lyase family protein [Rhizobium]|uniref:Uncharacterized protein n=2 Tax=Rhizobium TaxID=379 RepID=K0Q5E3_9HYPH|nr:MULTISPECIES: dimethylsulfonioproprionate lyase family protein [Rhizobium]KWV43455.1 hypothetical protein AS026_19870 [Rhizobium altiplani]CCM79997.1 conserved hypothetical protein [Rhizobium mesoamericanum STM3625]
MAGISASGKLGDDLLIEDRHLLDGTPRRKWDSARPAELQAIILALGDILLAEPVPLMAKFTAGKIINLLGARGAATVESCTSDELSCLQQIKALLAEASATSPSYKSLTDGLLAVVDRVDWFKRRAGAFASVNFEQSHSQGILLGPGALEHRLDVVLGLTFLGPYTRFPDHMQKQARVFLPLSIGEFRFGEEEWKSAGVGDVLFNPASSTCAMRCTQKSLLVLWCHLEGQRHTP